MASESVSTGAIPPGPDYQQGVDSAFLDLHQLRAIAQMMNDHPSVAKVDFPEELSGGILAMLTIASMGCEKIYREMFGGKREPVSPVEA